MPNNASFAMAKLSIAEMTGSRTYQLMAFAIMLLPWLLLIPASLFLIDIGKVYADLLFTGLHCWLVAYIFFIATPLLTSDIEQNIASIFLTLPMSRTAYFISRFAGVLLGILPLFFVYTSSSLFSLYLASSIWGGYLHELLWVSVLAGFLLILLPYISMVAVLFLIASKATGAAETSVFLLSVWILSWSIPPVLEALNNPDVLAKTPEFLVILLSFTNQLLPDLSSSSIALRLSHQLSIDSVQVLAFIFHHLGFSFLLLFIGCLWFQQRDLK